MINWYEMYKDGREMHAQRLVEADHKRLVAYKANRAHVGTLRSRLGQTLIDLGRWVDGRSDAVTRYDVEREGAR